MQNQNPKERQAIVLNQQYEKKQKIQALKNLRHTSEAAWNRAFEAERELEVE